MNNLTTRKIVLGMLMTLVLAFGMQSVVQAVTVTIDTNIPDSLTGSSTVEIQAGQSFEVTFAVTLNSRDRIQHPRGGSADQAVTSTSILNENRVDSSGYEAHRIGSTDYRTLNTAGTTYISSNTPEGYDIQRKRGSLYEAPADDTRLSRSNKKVYDTDGHQLYYYNSTTEDADVIDILEHHWVKKSDSEIYYYDEESIKIEPSSGLTLKLKSNGMYCHRKFRPLSNIRLCYNDNPFERRIPMAKRRKFTAKFKAEVVLRHSAVKVHSGNSVDVITSAKTRSQHGNANFLKMLKPSLSRQISSQASQRSGSFNLSNSLAG